MIVRILENELIIRKGHEKNSYTNRMKKMGNLNPERYERSSS